MNDIEDDSSEKTTGNEPKENLPQNNVAQDPVSALGLIPADTSTQPNSGIPPNLETPASLNVENSPTHFTRSKEPTNKKPVNINIIFLTKTNKQLNYYFNCRK